MSHRRIIIGDVHGHYDTLMSLLDAIAPTSDDDIYFLGDLIDRGPKSAEVVDFVIDNHYKCILGNHEQMLLDTLATDKISSHLLQSWLYSGGYHTLVSYNHHVSPDHIDWMKKLPLYLDLGDIWLVHAGIHPHRPIEDQCAQQFCWIRDDFHQMTHPYFEDKLIITGHTITFTFPGIKPGQLVSGAGWLDIDTGAYHPHSGWLTGVDLTHQIVYQAHSKLQTVRTLSLETAVVAINPAIVAAKRAKRSANLVNNP